MEIMEYKIVTRVASMNNQFKKNKKSNVKECQPFKFQIMGYM